jgi:hypothetical protein
MIPNNFIYIHGLNLERRILDNILHEVDSSDNHDNTVIFMTLDVNGNSDRLLPLIRKFFCIPKRMNDCGLSM